MRVCGFNRLGWPGSIIRRYLIIEELHSYLNMNAIPQDSCQDSMREVLKCFQKYQQDESVHKVWTTWIDEHHCNSDFLSKRDVSNRE